MKALKKRFHIKIAVGFLLILPMLPLSLAAEAAEAQVTNVWFQKGEKEIATVCEGAICAYASVSSQKENEVLVMLTAQGADSKVRSLSVKREKLAPGVDTCKSSPVTAKGGDRLKLFVWETKNMMPLCKTEILNNTARETDRETRAALNFLDKKFKKAQLDWLAGLYDKDSGGFYFSESARDNEGFGPDIESVVQTISTLQRLGVIGKIPEWYRLEAIEFLQSRQDPDDGYFYDPQFKATANQAKKERNTGFANACLRSDLGSAPLYKLPWERRGVKEAVLMAAPEEERYKTRENFLAWLNEIYATSINSYYWGSDVASAANMIKAYGRTGDLIEWLKEKQNPKTGMWEDTPSADGINGVLKISGFFNKNTEPYPNADAFIENCISISKTYVPRHASEAWNPLGALKAVKESYGDSLDYKLNGKIKNALPKIIQNIASSMDLFLMPDGGYGYTQYGSSSYSNDVLVSLGVREGDANAMSLMSLLYHNSYSLAGVTPGNVWKGYTDYFWNRLYNAKPIVKKDGDVVLYDEDFEAYDFGKLPIAIAKSGGGSAVIAADPVNGSANKVLRVSAVKGESPVKLAFKHGVAIKMPVSFKFRIYVKGGSPLYFSGFFGRSISEWLVISDGKTFTINHDSYQNGSGTVMTEKLKCNTWYDFELVYTPGENAENTFFDYYINGKKTGVGHNYYYMATEPARDHVDTIGLASNSGVEGTIFFDNVVVLGK